MYSTIRGVGALIYAKDTDRFLFLLRNGKKFDGSWGLVGGKIDDKETAGKALIREIKEEINLTLTEEKIIPLDTFTSTNKKFLFYTYLLIIENEFMPKLNEEHKGYCWCYLEDHPKPLHPGLHVTFRTNDVKQKIITAKNNFKIIAV